MSASVDVRTAEPVDAAALATCHLACWREAYTGMVDPDALEAELAEEDRRADRWRRILAGAHGTRLAVRDGEVVGFVSAGPQRDDDLEIPLELYALYVRQELWGGGHGHRLLGTALGEQDASLWVFEANARARRFYAAHGFVLDGTQKWDERFRAAEVRMVRRCT